jgi:hypothetical protein
MVMQTCPKCFLEGLPAADEICPSCGHSLTVLTQTTDGFSDESGDTVRTSDHGGDGAIRQKQNYWSVAARSASDIDEHPNPFAAPARTANLTSRPISLARSGLVWLLFSYSGRTSRRHDLDKISWWSLIGFIP